MREAYYIDGVRTPRARRKGKFTSVHPIDLMTYPLNELVKRHSVAPSQIEDVVLGCVTQTGEQGWCVARSCVLAAGWPIEVPATTVNRLCGSGQQATNFVAQGIQAGNYELAIAGGLEHMTRCQMFSDIGGEESPLLQKHHPDLVQQGESAEILSETYSVTRAQIDEFAYQSQMKAKQAQDAGRFSHSLCSVPYQNDDGETQILDHDDNLRPETTIEKLAQLKPAFRDNGVITAGNASAIVDGAAAILLASEEAVRLHSLKPRAKISFMQVVGSAPRIMLTGPIEASRKLLQKANLAVSDIDLWEINEAFAPVPLVVLQELKIDPEKVNVNGGAIALGHPLGATGAILIQTMVDELEARNLKRGIVTMCIGLGMGIATLIERS